jgi:uncharacterized RDD family membrane protein YckC
VPPPAGWGPPPPGWGYGPPPPRPVPCAPSGAPLADFSDRLLAYLIDYVILVGISLVFTIPAIIYQFSVMDDWMNEFATPGSPPPEPGELFRALAPLLWIYLGIFVLTMALYYVYRVELMFPTGQTVGKRVMKIRVVPVDPAATLTRGMAAKRWLVDSVAVQFIPVLSLLDGLWQLWDQPFRQCLHDKMAQTTVVKVLS